MSHLIPARLQGKSPDFSPWLSLLLFDARVPFSARRLGRVQAALGIWLLAHTTAGGGGQRQMCVISASAAWISTPLAVGWRPGCVSSSLSSLVSVHTFCSPGRGCQDIVSLPPVLVSGGRLAGSSMSHTQGCPRLCPHFGGSRLIRVAWVHGQQGRLFWLSPQRALQVAWRLGLGPLLMGSDVSFRGLLPVLLSVGDWA